MDVGYIDESHGNLWLKEAREISSMISGLIKTRRRFLLLSFDLDPLAFNLILE
jgi:hypothetical protein